MRSARSIIVAAILASASAASAFTAGNLVVSRVGDGSAALSGNASAVFVDQYTTGGSFVNALAMPTTASGSNFAFTLGATATSVGHITLSDDGKYVTMFGFDAPVGTTGPASNANFRGRTIARIDGGGVIDSSTRFEAAGMTPRAAVSVDGSQYWTTADTGAGTTGGLRYHVHGALTNGALLNATTSNIRTVNIFNNQLYIGASTGVGGDARGVSAVGSGLPTTASTFALLPGMGGSNTGNTDSTYDFVFADANTVYLADDDTSAPASGGLQKWTFDGATWTKAWQVLPTGASGLRSLAGRFQPTGAFELYGITANTTGGELVYLLDNGPVPTAASFNVLASAPTNTVFRGVDFAPIPEPATLGLLIGGAILAIRRR
jgi:hypothetical protein